MAASDSKTQLLSEAKAVAIFGDSWAEDNSHVSSGVFAGVQGWPVHLAKAINLPVAGNFAKGQSASSSLLAQLEAAETQLNNDPDLQWPDLLIVLHSGGNDFIGAERNYNPFAKDNFWLPHCMWGFRKKAEEVFLNLRNFLEILYKLGCRKFLVSDLPFTSAVPVLSIARLARVDKRGRWLSRRIREMVEDFNACCAAAGEPCTAAFISEVEALNDLAATSGGCAGSASVSLFLVDAFHPSHETHRRLAEKHVEDLQEQCLLEGRKSGSPASLPSTTASSSDAAERAEKMTN
eukprot:TRINITY_DN40602_c0_g1_i1.p1 TRINITY_DN40602_c0_g1~~TRINITY_DN40602_c0_g1_i1.p1  ORF type:complete len:312 (+),score=68.42 TRINITY_DN40602_c0_g1_i1:61-936(+)